MTRFLSIALLSLCYMLSAQADIYSASNALSRGDYETAVAEFTKLAEKGDASAQANLGYMYYAGEGVPQDYEKAVYWYRKAATQGNKDAQYNLAVSYAFGEGAKQDLTEAAIWYRRAGEQGHVVSQYSLGISYAYGEGVPQDQKEAARWFKKAADQGYARAQVQLGSMYHTGEGLEQNYAEAARWYRLAADRGDATAQYNLGTMYRSGKGVEQNYAQAKRWFRQSADQGYAAAQNELASLERSAGANVATRSIQTKPELPSVTETIPDPAPVKKVEAVAKVVEEPVQEKVAIQKPEPAPSVQTTDPEAGDTKKKPLFSVEKEGLLSLDDSELDIAEPEVVLEPEVEEKVVAQTKEVEKTVPVETSTAEAEVAQVVEADDSSAIHKALGLPTETDKADEGKKSSGGFFDKLFSKKEISEPDTIAKEEITETIEEEIIPEPEVKKEVVITPRVYPEDVKTAELATLEKNKVDEVVKTEAKVAMEEPVIEEAESSEGFFSRLFSSKESTETENIVDTIEEEPVIEVEEEIIPEPEVKKEVVITPRVYPEDVKTAELATLEKNKVDEVIKTEAKVAMEEPVVEEAESSEGFFDKLFSSKETSDTDTTATEESAEVTEEEPAIVIVEEIIPEPEIKAEEPVVADNNWAGADTAEENEEKESSRGLFSAIGDFFSGENKTEQTAINETESDDVLIAKAEEPVSAVEEIELAQEAETDLNQYSVQAGRRAITNNDYDEAYKQFKPLADSGDSEAQSHLGSLYYVGKGVNKDLTEAYNWYKKSADQGNMDAQYSVGNMFLLGEGVEQNNANAAKWYTLASEQGHVAAKNNLKSLEKLEALNRENQLKLDAMAAEQKAQEYAVAEETDKPDEVAVIEEQTTDAESEKVVAEEKNGLLGLLGGLFGSKSPESDTTEETTESLNKVTAETVNDIEVVEIEPAQTKLNTTVEEKVTTQANSSSEINSVEEETEQSNNIAAVDDSASTTSVSKSESPGFFKSLFGSNDIEKTNEIANVDLESTEKIENIDAEPVEPEEVITVETEVVKIEEVTNEADDTLTETTEVVDSTEESGGLFGFLGNVFSSDKKNETNNNEAVVTEEIAMLETDTEQATNNIDNVVVEEITKETTSKTEVDRLRPLAIQGDQDAQYRLGVLYYSGSEVKQDFSQAALWYRRAAEQGNVDAQYSLGNMYLMGEGIGQDDNQAAHWYELAAEQGHNSAKHNLESLKNIQVSSAQVEIETTSNSGQLISLDEKVPDASLVEDTTGKREYEQGLAYAFGDGVPQNDRTAFNLFYEAAEKGYVLAQYKLGVAFAYGEGVRQDNNKAVEWYRKAAEQGHTIAQRNLATMYLDGKGVEQNKVQALAWYQVVANAGNAMDLRRRDMLQKELSDVELSESQQLAEQISRRITNPSL